MDRQEDFELAGKGEGIVHFKVEGPVCILTLDHAETLNAMTPGVMAGLGKGLEEAEADNDVRAVIITGAGRAWCSGADVRSFGAMAEGFSMASVAPLMGPAMKIRNIPKPVIAAVNGVAAGGGCNLCLLCDIRIFGESGRMSEIFVRRGLQPDTGGSYSLPRLVGLGKAAQMILTGEMVGAQDCLKWGLANEVVPDDRLLPRAIEIAKEIAVNCAPLAVAQAKAALYMGMHLTLEQVIAMELQPMGNAVLFKTEDLKEATTAFLQKRPPAWKGK